MRARSVFRSYTLTGPASPWRIVYGVAPMLLPVSVEHGSPKPDGRAFHVTSFVVHFLKELVDRRHLFRVNIRREGINVRVFH